MGFLLVSRVVFVVLPGFAKRLPDMPTTSETDLHNEVQLRGDGWCGTGFYGSHGFEIFI